MIEGRALVQSLEKAKASVTKLGGQFKSYYIFKDVIFVPKKKNYNWGEDLVRVRVYCKNDWPTKKVVLVRKKTEWKGQGKKDTIILKKEFDTEKEAFAFIKKNVSEFEKECEYLREGWQYELKTYRIFIENIEKYRPSIEIEADNESDLQILFQKIGAGKIVTESVPEIMRRILKNPSIS